MAKQKIAVLGGGMGSLSAVYAITNQPGWDEHYEITIHQLGWRLGGKAATSRKVEDGARIEEHGYHTLFGFYENTFAVMRDCYEKYGRDKSLPVSELIAKTPEDERLHPERYGLHREDWFIMLQQLVDQSWHTFPIEFPRNTDLPGSGGMLPSPLAYIEMALELLWRILTGQLIPHPPQGAHTEPPAYWEPVSRYAGHLLHGLDPLSHDAHSYTGHLDILRKLAKHLHENESAHAPPSKDTSLGLCILVDAMRAFLRILWALVKNTVQTSWPEYLVWTTCDFIVTTLIGMIEDDVFVRGLNSIDNVNFWEWIRNHGTVVEGTEITNGSMWVQAAYDSSFAYLKGDTTTPRSSAKPPLGVPSMGAGTMLRGGMRLMLTYKGAMAWKFWSGTADVLCAPIYSVLKARGVRFEFFSKVLGLGVGGTPGAYTIDKIGIQKQVSLVDEAAGYDPLIVVKDVPCWPAEPKWELIRDPEPIKQYDLESYWTPWPGVQTKTLTRGVDFDLVLLGISVGMLKHITPELSDVSPGWSNMVNGVLTVRTEAIQTWMTKDLAALGWTGADAPVNVGVQPLDTWADMSQLLARETWPVGTGPVSVQYFCSAMKDDPNEPAPPDAAYPPTQRAWVLEDGVQFFESQSTQFWPKARLPSGGFDWSTMWSKTPIPGSAVLDTQFIRANIDPSERYVLSVPSSSSLRIAAHGSDFGNLYLAGDWTLNGLNVGCMEATVTSGLLASQAIAGYPTNIVGLADFGPPKGC